MAINDVCKLIEIPQRWVTFPGINNRNKLFYVQKKNSATRARNALLLTDDCKNILVDHAGYLYEHTSSSHYDEKAEHLEMSSQSKNNPYTYVNFENDN